MPTDIRKLVTADRPAVNEIYNHYIVSSPATFDIEPYPLNGRTTWFEQFGDNPKHQCLVAHVDGVLTGFACSSAFKARAAYDTSIEVSVYLHHSQFGKGLGYQLYTALFDLLAGQPIHRMYAGVTLPNDASVALHQKFGFSEVGRYHEVGYKFDRYWDVVWLEKRL